MTAQPLIDYFTPLMDWLKIQNEGELIGWDEQCPPGTIVSDNWVTHTVDWFFLHEEQLLSKKCFDVLIIIIISIYSH